jgi:hypothetical protein
VLRIPELSQLISLLRSSFRRGGGGGAANTVSTEDERENANELTGGPPGMSE